LHIEEIEKVTKVDDSLFSTAMLCHAYAAAGMLKEAQKLLDELKARKERGDYIQSHAMALIYTAFGDKDQAFEWLAKAYDERSEDLLMINVDPKLDRLRPDPRFSALLAKMGFE